MDRSVERRKHMESLLANIHIPNTRIQAIDGRKQSRIPITCAGQNRDKLDSCDDACARSHINAVKYLHTLAGDYFMVVEDDVIFDNMALIPYDLATIIKQAPPFDVLQIGKICLKELPDMYTKWDLIAGCQAYIVSRAGVQRLHELYSSHLSLRAIAEYSIYMPCNTYTYKYNCADSLCTDSNIHSSHIQSHIDSKNLQRDIILRDFCAHKT